MSLTRPTLDDRGITWDGIMVGPIPPFFVGQICTGHYQRGWTRNPLDVEQPDKYIWVCGDCLRPSRIALVNCVGCEQWWFDMRLDATRNDGHTRTEYFCEECNG